MSQRLPASGALPSVPPLKLPANSLRDQCADAQPLSRSASTTPIAAHGLRSAMRSGDFDAFLAEARAFDPQAPDAHLLIVEALEHPNPNWASRYATALINMNFPLQYAPPSRPVLACRV
jgi:hypothetical protein